MKIQISVLNHLNDSYCHYCHSFKLICDDCKYNFVKDDSIFCVIKEEKHYCIDCVDN